jgi:hypothetical protein
VDGPTLNDANVTRVSYVKPLELHASQEHRRQVGRTCFPKILYCFDQPSCTRADVLKEVRHSLTIGKGKRLGRPVFQCVGHEGRHVPLGGSGYLQAALDEFPHSHPQCSDPSVTARRCGVVWLEPRLKAEVTSPRLWRRAFAIPVLGAVMGSCDTADALRSQEPMLQCWTQKAMSRRPRVPPAESISWALAASSGGNVRATRSVSWPEATRRASCSSAAWFSKYALTRTRSITMPRSDGPTQPDQPRTEANFPPSRRAGSTAASSNAASNASTGAQSVCDLAGNCATAGPVGGNKVDKKPPTITLQKPLNGEVFQKGSFITAAYTCTDGGSGVSTCSGTVPNGTAIDTSTAGTQSFTVTTSDMVGNTNNVRVMYTVQTGAVQGETKANVGFVSVNARNESTGKNNSASNGNVIRYEVTVRMPDQMLP